jgi:hypothetical protein
MYQADLINPGRLRAEVSRGTNSWYVCRTHKGTLYESLYPENVLHMIMINRRRSEAIVALITVYSSLCGSCSADSGFIL